MDRFVELGRWMDCYGALLTERQAAIMGQYANENCSLAEIAERENISRQGVRDILIRAEQQLLQYENKLHLAERLTRQQKVIEKSRRTIQKAELNECDRTQILRDFDSIELIWEDEDGI